MARTLYVTAFSLFFYYRNSGAFVSLLFFTAFWDHGLGLAIHATEDPRARKLWISLSVASNLGLLGYFKYSGLLARTVQALAGHDVSAVDLVVPVGLSFFTFQSLSYTIDIYRRKLAPAPSVLDFLFFVSFFPHLVAGPIVRAADFLPQVRQAASLTLAEMDEAFLLIGAGLLKKVILADSIGLRLVDPIFDNPARHTGPECVLAILGYSVQIYGDFSGYTDLALGIALLMGFRLCENFNQPYRAASLTEFWRRWHMSLSRWLRDYLYVPLGGSRKGTFRTYLNLMLTMLLGGLWHGASWRFMVWGGVHGVGLAIERALGVDPEKALKGWRYVWRTALTFLIVSLAWILFRVESLNGALSLLQGAAQATDLGLWQAVLKAHAWTLVLILVGLLMHWMPLSAEGWRRFFGRNWLGMLVNAVMDSGKGIAQNLSGFAGYFLRALVLALFFLIVWQFQCQGAQPFIYFQF